MMGGSSAPCASVAPVLLAEAMADRDNNGGTPWDAANSKPGVNYQPPQGAWKDGLCAWRNQLAPSCLIATFFPLFSLSLLSQRVGWSYKRHPCDAWCCPSGPDSPFQRTRNRVRWSIFAAFCFTFSAIMAALHMDGWRDYIWVALLATNATLLYLDAPVTTLARVRQRARERLQLPPICGSPEAGDRTAYMGDYLLSCFCPRLVKAQLLRHLFDFKGRSDPRWPKGPEDAEMLV